MFGYGFACTIFADQLSDRPENRHIPEQVRSAARQLPGACDLIVAVIMDTTGRQWWAITDRYRTELAPVRIHIPTVSPDQWRLPGTFDASLWTAALALDEGNTHTCYECGKHRGGVCNSAATPPRRSLIGHGGVQVPQRPVPSVFGDRALVEHLALFRQVPNSYFVEATG